jgi:hypothetical protein
MAAITPPTYCGEHRALPVRFVNNAIFYYSNDIGDHEEQPIEQLGDVLMWPSINLPVKIWNAFKDPRVLIIAGGALAMLADSYIFYRTETHEWVVWAAHKVLPVITLERVHKAAWIGTMYEIFALTTRAAGRAFNTALTTAFYATGPAAPPVADQQEPAAQ